MADTNYTNYTALAAECEKKAEQGEKPVMEWVIEKEYRATLNQADKECVLYSNGWRVRSRMTGHTYFSDVLLHCLPAAQLFAEALLRDATKLLHQGVYNELATTKDMLNTTHGQIAEMCEYLGLKREDVPCDAWALRDEIIRIRDRWDVLRAEVQVLIVSNDYRGMAIHDIAALLGVGMEAKCLEAEVVSGVGKLRTENQRLRALIGEFKDRIGHAEWGCDRDAATILQEIVDEFWPKCKSLSPEASHERK